MTAEQMVQRGFIVSGRVQGVFFRAWAQNLAQDLGLTGTIRNRSDGTVEAHVAGAAEKVGAFHSRLKDGPTSARVTEVRVLQSSGDLPADSFKILPTR